MKRKSIQAALSVIAIIAFSHGFTEGMEWHRLASCMIGGVCLGLCVLYNK